MNESQTVGMVPRLWKFLRKPLHEQSRSFYARWKEHFPSVAVPVRLPFGAWWLARDDYLGSTLTFDGFEPAEERKGIVGVDLDPWAARLCQVRTERPVVSGE